MAENKRHKGHRQRMRERVQSYGLDSLAEHEALEYVLYLTNAQKDTNGIAHDLIDRFGDFAAVLEASEEELCTVEGVGPSPRGRLDLKSGGAAAIKGGTAAGVRCHNHPNGVALPSLEDMDATGSIARALGLVNVHLLDHFILTDTEYFSMRDANRLPIYDFKTGTLFWP